MSTTSSSPSLELELLGSTNWEKQLDPELSLPLRQLILSCGDLCQVTYDSFISDPHSKYCGANRYGRLNLLSKTLFPSAQDYAVPAFLYATCELDQHLPAKFLFFSLSREAWSKESNWVGYIAVTSSSPGTRQIYVSWRGTIRDIEWMDVLNPQLVPIKDILTTTTEDLEEDDEPKVMKGWHVIYTSSDPKSPFTKTSARDQLIASISQLISTYANDSISIICVGHSLGASLAVLSAFDLVENGVNKKFPVCALVFGSPQVGNKSFNERVKSLPNLKILHVRNKIDLIPLYPSRALGYVDTVGEELVVDTRKSPYLKDSKNPSDWHNLQAILHVVNGWNGEEGEFEMKVKRSIALVNKSCEYLKDELLVPGAWWVEKNKGMVQVGEDGEWTLAEPKDDDMPNAEYLKDGTTGAAPAPAPKEETKKKGSWLCCVM